MIVKEKKKEIVDNYRTHDSDTGSPEVQVALLTERIIDLTEHMKRHKKDYATQRGLLMLVAQRSSQLTYLSRIDFKRYKALIGRLGLRK